MGKLKLQSLKKITLLLLLTIFLFNNQIFTQKEPLWTKSAWRETNYPSNEFFIGYQMGNKRSNETLEVAKNRISKEAQALLSESIIVNIQSTKTTKTSSAVKKDSEEIASEFESAIQTFSNIELIGIKNEVYNDSKSEIIYALSYIKKAELIEYYKRQLSLNVNQIEVFVKTTQNLTDNSEKVKAKEEIEKAKTTFANVRYIQTMLTVFGNDININELEQKKIDELYNLVSQISAALSQAIYIFVESKEDLFGEKVNIVSNKLKSELSQNGCSFVANKTEADYILKINVTTRLSNTTDAFVFCYADTKVELYDNHKQKVVYGDEISQKGGSDTKDKAGRKAMNDVVSVVIGKIKTWIN